MFASTQYTYDDDDDDDNTVIKNPQSDHSIDEYNDEIQQFTASKQI